VPVAAQSQRKVASAKAAGDILAAALEYRRRGWMPIPMPAGTKKPGRDGWQNERYTAETIPRAFAGAGGVSLLCGAPSGGLLDVDPDTAEAAAAWDFYSPGLTGLSHKRATGYRHDWYTVDAAPAQTERLCDVDASTLIELRSTGGQTVVPPSVHDETAELLAWLADGEPAHVELRALQRAVRFTAAAALLARHYPPEGGRHDYRLALAGLLIRGGLTREDAERLMTISAGIVGADEHDAAAAVRDTAAAIDAGKRATGATRLAELLPHGPKIVSRLRDWLDLRNLPADEQVPRLRVVTIAELITAELPARERILSPILFSQSLNMVFARRGVGKSYFGMGLGYAVAGGGSFLRYRADRPRRVLLVDGEMPAVLQRERFTFHIDAADFEADADAFKIITPDLQERSLPDLGTRTGQGAIEEHLADVEFLILDNLSALVRSGVENDAESWLPIQEWALHLRRRGIVVLFIHHAGQSGNQRGTTKREDLLDTVIELRRPRDYDPTQGARFEVHLTKARGVYGPDAEPFEAALVADREGKAVWTIRTMEDRMTAQVADLVRDGEPYRDIAKTLGTTKSTVERHVRKAREQGLL
jgi:AAA domain/Bifunctional DNA primase/polymerase, N-terminal